MAQLSKTKNIESHLGGKWTYRGFCGWFCDTDDRMIIQVSAGVDEFDNETGPAQLWLYGGGQISERAACYVYNNKETSNHA